MNMNYKYSASKPSLINYSYKIDAIVGANYTNDGNEYNVWNKTYNLKTIDSKQANDNIQITEDINIDYQKYNKEVKSFKQTLGMNVDAFLYIKLIVNTSTIINHQEIKNEYISNFSISLGDKIAVVDDKNEDIQIDSVKHENTITSNNINIPKLIINLIILLFLM